MTAPTPTDLAGLDVLVLGLGISGRSAAVFCHERGARVTAADDRTAEALGGLDLPASVATALGGPLPDAADFDLVVPSPGVPPSRYARGARRVWGDVELAARHLHVPVVAVTGTNGKSTTVRLLESMLRAGGLRAEAAGNVGRPRPRRGRARGLVLPARDDRVLPAARGRGAEPGPRPSGPAR
jgi:UDP-N-acetylmuramoylalanine--D-glutamate ligase